MTPSNHDTIPVPKDPQGQLAHDLSELKLAMARVYECLERVAKSVMRVELCELTVEHRQNTQREKLVAGGRWLADHERRLRVLEGLGDDFPESTAAE